MSDPSDTVLNITKKSGKWNFANSPGNFESAGGLCYTVDVTRSAGDRVDVSGFADGRPFDLDGNYGVALTSYRYVGAGGFLKAAGIGPEERDAKTVVKGPEYRSLLYKFFLAHPILDAASVSDPKVVGSWKFIPEPPVRAMLERDLKIVFGE